MKILHLIDVFDSTYYRDQIEIVKILESKGHSITVITSRYCEDGLKRGKSQFEESERKKFPKAKILHTPSLKIHTPFFEPIIAYVPPPSTIVPWGYDIVHAYSVGTYSSFLGALLRKFKKAKVVLRSDLSSTTYEKAKNDFLYRGLLTTPLKAVDATYVFTNAERGYLVDLGIPEEKIWVIPIGVDYEKFSRVSSPRVDDTLVIGYIGRILPGKGVHRIVSPLLRLSKTTGRIKVLLAGPKTDVSYANDIIRRMETNRDFKYLGVMPAVQFFRMCDVCILPSIYETGAKVVLEAMAAGKTVVASNIVPVNEYIKHGYNGFLFKYEDETYALCKNLVEKPDLMKKIGDNARKEAAKYDWKTIINKLENMYENVTSRKR